MIDVYPRYARAAGAARAASTDAAERRGGRGASPSTTCATCRSGRSSPGSTRSTSTATSGCSALVAKGRRLHRRRQGAAARGGARAAERGHPGVPRRGRARPDRDLDLAVLPPDSAAAVRHRHLQAHAPATRAMPRQRFMHPEDALEQLERAAACHERLFGRRPVGPLAVGGLGLGRDGAARRAGGLRVDGHRRTDPGAHAGHDVHARRPTATSSSPSGCTRPIACAPGGAAVACAFRDHALSDLIGFVYAGWAADAAADDFVERLVEAGRRYAARTGGGEAPSPSSSTARTPGSTSKAAAGRSCGRCTAGCRTTPSSDRHDGRGLRGAGPRARRASSRARGSTPTSTSGSAIADDQRAWSQLAEARRGARRRRPGSTTRRRRPGARGDADRRRQRLVLVVRRRPLVRPRPRIRRPLPAPSAERLPAARQAGSRRAVRQQHLDAARGRRRDAAPTACSRRRSTARRRATSSGWAPARSRSGRWPGPCTRPTRRPPLRDAGPLRLRRERSSCGSTARGRW